ASLEALPGEIIVVRMVLHHDYHHVIDLRREGGGGGRDRVRVRLRAEENEQRCCQNGKEPETELQRFQLTALVHEPSETTHERGVRNPGHSGARSTSASRTM